MTKVTLTDETLTVEMEGWRRLLALKRRLTIPRAQVRGAERAAGNARPRGLRLPGSYVPGVIYAGSYYKGKGVWEFWDVRRPERAIVIHLDGHKYARVVVEVERPDEAVAEIEQVMRGRAVTPPRASHNAPSS